MRLLTGYLLRQLTGVVALCLLLGAGLVYLLQVLRLGHHLAGALSARLLAEALLLSLPTLLLGCLPLALAAAVLFSLGRLADRGEIEAMAAAGAAPLQLARPPLLIAGLAAALTVALASLEPGSLAALAQLASSEASRSLVLRAPPREFHDLGGATLYFEARRAGSTRDEVQLERLLLALDDPAVVVLARNAWIRLDLAGTARIVLEEGELQSLPAAPRGPVHLRRVRFAAAELGLDPRPAVRAQLGFLGGLAGGAAVAERAGRGASACLALTALALAIGLGASGHSRRAWLGLAATAGYELASFGAAVLGGTLGALALDGVVLLACGGRLARGSRAGRATF